MVSEHLQSNVISNSDNSNFHLYRGRTLVLAASHCNRRGKRIGFIEHCYIEYAAPPHTSTALLSKSTHLTLAAGRRSAGEMRHHKMPTVSSHRPPTVMGADTMQHNPWPQCKNWKKSDAILIYVTISFPVK